MYWYICNYLYWSVDFNSTFVRIINPAYWSTYDCKQMIALQTYLQGTQREHAMYIVHCTRQEFVNYESQYKDDYTQFKNNKL